MHRCFRSFDKIGSYRDPQKLRTPDTGKLKEILRKLPHRPGVYLMKDRLGEVIYVGKAKDLKKRVSSYFQPGRFRQIDQPKIRTMVTLVHDLETIEVRSEAEAILLEGRLIKDYRPRYNTDFTDDKRFLLIRVDVLSKIPKFRLSRNRTQDGSVYFGPFAHAGPLRRTLSQMRQKFGIILADASPKTLPDGRIRLYDDARSEIYGHANEITLAEYQERVQSACTFLDGKSREWLKELEEEMREKAAEQRFEEAATLRDTLLALRQTIKQTRKFTRALPEHNLAENGSDRLAEALNLEAPPQTIECFDISHISGSFTVASMVRFSEGRPDKKNYRRFKIRSFDGNDDFRAMEEVVGRRYRRMHQQGSPFPDLVVIDGGKGQVTAALRAFLILDLDPPPLIGLAKKEETIIFASERSPLRLPLHDPGIRLLQRVRDEAHRFANTFNAELRSKKIRESILDDVPGLGPKRRMTLLDAFGSIQDVKNASLEDLAKVDGIGPNFARKIFEHLQRTQSGSPPQS
ncbi:MAG: excinuclease ABC subunit UvrC [Puniceicoccales bacterium]